MLNSVSSSYATWVQPWAKMTKNFAFYSFFIHSFPYFFVCTLGWLKDKKKTWGGLEEDTDCLEICLALSGSWSSFLCSNECGFDNGPFCVPGVDECGLDNIAFCTPDTDECDLGNGAFWTLDMGFFRPATGAFLSMVGAWDLGGFDVLFEVGVFIWTGILEGRLFISWGRPGPFPVLLPSCFLGLADVELGLIPAITLCCPALSCICWPVGTCGLWPFKTGLLVLLTDFGLFDDTWADRASSKSAKTCISIL